AGREEEEGRRERTKEGEEEKKRAKGERKKDEKKTGEEERDTVGSVSMKDDDTDNLRNEACKVEGGGDEVRLAASKQEEQFDF
ncbi:hypothetical protein F7725_003004, partial [Dissostichus mawsoni]